MPVTGKNEQINNDKQRHWLGYKQVTAELDH